MSDEELKRVTVTGVIESIELPPGKTVKILAISEERYIEMRSRITDLEAKLTARDESLDKANTQIERQREYIKEIESKTKRQPPCTHFCEATAFKSEIARRDKEIERMREELKDVRESLEISRSIRSGLEEQIIYLTNTYFEGEV